MFNRTDEQKIQGWMSFLTRESNSAYTNRVDGHRASMIRREAVTTISFLKGHVLEMNTSQLAEALLSCDRLINSYANKRIRNGTSHITTFYEFKDTLCAAIGMKAFYPPVPKYTILMETNNGHPRCAMVETNAEYCGKERDKEEIVKELKGKLEEKGWGGDKLRRFSQLVRFVKSTVYIALSSDKLEHTVQEVHNLELVD